MARYRCGASAVSAPACSKGRIEARALGPRPRKNLETNRELRRSFRDKTFVVVDSDARIRRDDDVMAFVHTTGGGFQVISKGTKVKIVEVKVAETGSRSSIVFGRATSVDGTRVLGWTSTRNLEGNFMNETIGVVQPAPGASRFGPNAAWSDGEFLGQLELAAIVDSKLELERLALKTIEPYFALVAAAAEDGVLVLLNSGFRSYPEQKHLHDGFARGLPGFNTAAKPGFSKHQNGIAFVLLRLSLPQAASMVWTMPLPWALTAGRQKLSGMMARVASAHRAIRCSR